MRDVTLLEPHDEHPQFVEARFLHRPPPHDAGDAAWVDFHEYRRIVYKHLGLVLAIVAVCVGLTLIHDLITEPGYTASTTLLIRSAPSRVFQEESVSSTQDSSQPEPYDDTQDELLKSSNLATRVILKQRLWKLGTQSAHASGSWLSGRGTARAAVTVKRATPTVDDPLADSVPSSLVQWYLGVLQVKPIEHTQLVRIEFTTSDPELSARIANAHAREFIRWGLELNAQASDEAQQFLAGKLNDLKQRIELSDLALNRYRRDKGIIPGLISLNGRQDVVVEQLNKISQDFQNAHLKTITMGTELELVKSGHADALPQVMDNRMVQGLKGDLDRLESRYLSMHGEYTDDYPEMRELREKIDGTRAILGREIKTAMANVNEQYEAALEREKAIGAELNKQKGFALGLNDVAIKYVMLERESETNRAIYDAVLKRMKDLTVVADAHASNISIVDPAQPPLTPASPRTKRDLIAASALGLLLGICAALFIERLDNTFKTTEDLERHLKLPGLAIIPDFNSASALTSRYGGGYLAKPTVAKLPANGTHRSPLVATYGKYSVLGESFRQLRTTLRLSRAGAPPKVTMFTSSVPGEGKTTVSVNIATVLSHTDAKVLIIDADMRRPRCHRVLGLNNRAGLSEALTGVGGTELVQPTGFDNLFLLSCGRIPPNPSELLGSPRMKEFLRELSEAYDYIIIDTPPVMLVTDAADLAEAVDGVVLIAAGGQTPRHLVAAALGRLEYANAKILGVVLNKVQLHKAEFPHYYSKPYQGYYQGFEDVDGEETSFDDALPAGNNPERADDTNYQILYKIVAEKVRFVVGRFAPAAGAGRR
jgi:polysaccharide biosynthesis transport protein